MFNSNQKGFTLIELMVTTGMMLLLLSVIIANFGSLGKTRNLNIAKNNTISDIRRVQSLALASKDVSTGIPSGYYGLRFDTQTPSLYSFISQDNTGLDQTIITTSKLPPNVRLTSISVLKANGATVLPSAIDIYFKTTYGRVFVTYSGNSASGLKEGDDVITLTYTSLVDNISTVTMVINGITGNVN